MHTLKIPQDRHIGFDILVMGWTLLALATSCQLRQARGEDKEGPIRSNRKSPASSRKLKMTINPKFFTVSPPSGICRTES